MNYYKTSDDIAETDKKVKKEVWLKEYSGPDKVVHAEEKKKEIEEQNKYKPKFSVDSKIPGLDECIQGFRKGQLIIISGPTKNGKTQFCQTLTKSFIFQGKKCVWFSYEVGMEELFDKFPMKELDFYVPRQMESGNLDWIEDKIIESKEKFGTDIVFIDNLDFLRDTRDLKVSLNLSAYIGGIVQRIKRFAIEHDVVIFLMSHIRKNKWTSNELPSSEELRDSGQIAQLSDFVLMIIRKRAPKDADEIYEGTNALLGVMENRFNGRTKKIPLVLKDNEFFEEEANVAFEQYDKKDEVW